MPSRIDELLADLPECTARAVAQFWKTRKGQAARQQEAGKQDADARSAVRDGVKVET
jgi:hypothetical protein